MIRPQHLPRIIGCLCLMLVAACTNSTRPSTAPTASVSASPTLSAPARTVPPLSTLAPAPTLTLPAPTVPRSPQPSPPTIPGTRLPPAIVELAIGFGGPDDLVLLSDGRILFSDVGNGTVNQIGPDGQVMTLLRGLAEPEGIVVLPDGTLIIAEQGKDRLVRYRPQSGQPVVTWLALENKTHGLGVDGIARDPVTGEIIVPDSPNGTILRVSADGKTSRVIARGFERPTGAVIERDASIIVADENGRTVTRIRTDGRAELLGHFSMPDDVVIDAAGNIFVASLGDNSVRRIDPLTHRVTLIAHIQNPQGIVMDADQNLIVTEASLNRILRIKIH